MTMTLQDLMEIHGPLKEAQYLYEARVALEHCFERLGYSEKMTLETWCPTIFLTGGSTNLPQNMRKNKNTKRQ